MKMTKVDALPPSASGKKKMPKNLAILQEFLNSGFDIVLLEDYPHKNSYSCATALARSARNFGLPVRVLNREGQVYLLNEKTTPHHLRIL